MFLGAQFDVKKDVRDTLEPLEIPSAQIGYHNNME
jgi:hypothetical protein